MASIQPLAETGFVDTASNGGGRSRELVASETGFSWTRCQGGTRSRSHVWGCRGAPQHWARAASP
jgi:hypothetical protein